MLVENVFATVVSYLCCPCLEVWNVTARGRPYSQRESNTHRTAARVPHLQRLQLRMGSNILAGDEYASNHINDQLADKNDGVSRVLSPVSDTSTSPSASVGVRSETQLSQRGSSSNIDSIDSVGSISGSDSNRGNLTSDNLTSENSTSWFAATEHQQHQHSQHQHQHQHVTSDTAPTLAVAPTAPLLGASAVHVMQRFPECVICLEEFSNENPAMHTLCACGENKALFHYPCLLLWLENKRTCPSCSSELFYEERLIGY